MTSVVNQEQCPSLTELEERHESLVETASSDTEVSPEALERFIELCQAMGHILEAPADRNVAQSFITYWVNRRSRLARRLAKHSTVGGADNSDLEDEEAGERELASPVPCQADRSQPTRGKQNASSYLLCEFQQSAFDDIVVSPTNAWLERLSDADYDLVGQIVLRLMTLKSDGTFEFVPATQLALEGLLDVEHAKELLDKLVRLGIVRRQRRSLDLEEYTLHPLPLLGNWVALKIWMQARLDFRHSAKETLQRQITQAQKLQDRPLAAVWRFVRSMMTQLGARMQQFYSIFLGGIISNLLSDETKPSADKTPMISERAMREAEYYHDKNSEEIKLLYLKRQMDRFESEINQERLFGVSCVLCLVIAATAFAFYQWHRAHDQTLLANKQTELAEQKKQEAVRANEEVTKALEQVDRTAKVSTLLLADRSAASAGRNMHQDPAGAWLQAMRSYYAIEDNQSVLKNSAVAERWTQSHLLSVASASVQSPVLMDVVIDESPTSATSLSAQSRLAYPDKSIAQAPTALTILSDNGELAFKVQVQAGQLMAGFCTKRKDGTWQRHAMQPLELPDFQGKFPRQPFSACLNSSGTHAAIVCRTIEPDRAFVFVGPTPLAQRSQPQDAEVKPLQFLEQFVFTSPPAFDSSGKFFGLVAHATATPPEDSSGDIPGQAMIWSTANWKKLLEQELPVSGLVSAVAFSRESSMARNQGMAASIRMATAIADKAQGVEVQQLTLNIQSEAASKDKDQPQAVWEPVYAASVFKAENPVLLLYSSQDPNLLFCSHDDQQVLIHPGRTGMTSAVIDSKPAVVNKGSYCKVAAFSPDGSRLALGFRDGQIAVWKVDGEQIQNETESRKFDFSERVPLPSDAMHSGEVFGVRFSPSNKYLVSCGRDKVVQIYDLDAQQLAAPPMVHNGTINAAKVTDDGRFITTLTRGTIQSWEFPSVRSPVQSFGLLATGSITTMTRSANGVLAIGGWRSESGVKCGWIRLYSSVESSAAEPVEIILPRPVKHLAIHRDGQWLCCLDQRGEATLFHQGKAVWSGADQTQNLRIATFDPYSASPRLLLCGEKRSMRTTSTVQIWRVSMADSAADPVRGMELEHAFEIPQEDQNNIVATAGFDPWGMGCVVATETGRLYVFQREGNRVVPMTVQGFQPHTERVTSLAFHDQTHMIVCGSEDDMLTCWQVGTPAWASSGYQPERAHAANITTLVFSPSGDRLASASADGLAVVWQLKADAESRTARFQVFQTIDPKWDGPNLTSALVQLSFVAGDASEGYIFCRWKNRAARIFNTLKIHDPDPLGEHDLLIDGKEVATFTWSHDVADARLELAEDGQWVLAAEGFENGPSDSLTPRADETPPLNWNAQVRLSRTVINPLPAAILDANQRKHLRAWVSLTSGRESTGLMRQLSPIPVPELASLWKEAQSVRTLWPPASPLTKTAWHLREIGNSLNNLAAIKWHMERLAEEDAAAITPRARLQFATALGQFKSSLPQALVELGHAEAELGHSPDFLTARAAIRESQWSLTLDKSIIEGAISDYRQILAQQPQDIVTRIRLIKALNKDKRSEESLAELNPIIQATDERELAVLVKLRGVAHARLDNLELALKDMVRAGELFQRYHNYEDAYGEYTKAVNLLEKKFAGEDRHVELASLYVKLGDVLGQFDSSKRSSKISANECYFKACQIDPESLTNLTSFFKSLPDEEIGSHRVYTWDNVNELFEQATLLAKGDAEVYRERIKFLLPKGPNVAGLDNRFELVFEAFQAMEANAQMSVQDYLGWAAAHVYRDQLAEAEQVLLRGKTKFAGFSIVDVRLGLVLALQGKAQPLANLISEMLAASDDSPETKNNIAWTSLFSDQPRDDFAPIVKLAESAGELSGDDPAYLNTLGGIYARSGRFQDAIDILHRATDRRNELLKLSSTSQDRLYGNAIDQLFASMAHRGLGNRDEAEGQFRQAQEAFEAYNKNEPKGEFADWVWNEREYRLFFNQARQGEEL